MRKRLLILCAVYLIAALTLTALLGAPMSNSDGVAPNYYLTRDNPRTFTWMSYVTPELAEWAKNLSFTDVVVCNASRQNYLYLRDQGIEYWYCVSCYAPEFADLTNAPGITKALLTFAQASPNSHVCLDDFNHFLDLGNISNCNKFLDAVRNVQNNQTRFILDAYVAPDAPNYDAFSQLNLTDIDLDAYHQLTRNYTSILPQLLKGKPRSVGFYVWAWEYIYIGASWQSMTDAYLASVYDEAIACNASRVGVWNGFVPQANSFCMNFACLYNYPQWWGEVKTGNLKFLEGG
jgi:hypothetical protein